MFDFIFSVYARIIRSIMRATSAPVVANFMLPPLRGRIVGRECDLDFHPIMIGEHYTVWDWSMEGIVLQTAQNGTVWIDRSDTPEPVWIGTVDWFMARQAQ